ncbi:hypothetical protein OROMI_012461 [Orobanche minor]
MKKNPTKLVIGLLLFSLLEAIADAEYRVYKDPNRPINRRIKDLLKRMTLEEKNRPNGADRTNRGVSRGHAETLYRGSVLSGGGSSPGYHASPETWVDMVNEFQKGSLSTRLGIPMLYGIDAVHGHNTAHKATNFPHNIGLGATRDPRLVKNTGAATALELRATGIPYTFAPCIAVCRDPRWDRCYESYSEDPTVVEAMTEIIPGLQGDIPSNSRKGVPYVGGKQKVAACAKHYVGDGGTIKGINSNNTMISYHGLLSIHMPAYDYSIIKGVATVMVSYSSLNGIRMHANRDFITRFLKQTMRFRGFVISDYMGGIDQITSPIHANYTYSILAGVGAGIDMVMIPYNYTEFINGLMFLVRNEFIPTGRIDDAVKRILRVKFIMGLFENPLADYSLSKYLGAEVHRERAREAVRKSLVLLKNGESGDEPILPLAKKASKILVAGSHANDIGHQCGGWTLEWQGKSGNITAGTTVLDAIRNTVDSKTEIVYVEKPDDRHVNPNKFSYAIVVVGEKPYAEGYGDSLNLTLHDTANITITNVCASVKCVVVLITGHPVVIQPYLAQMDGLVAAWLPGTEGQGVADVLFGDYGFSGRLPCTWFKTFDQLPINVGDEHYDPLFPFGFGLTTN